MNFDKSAENVVSKAPESLKLQFLKKKQNQLTISN
jgi:hypothetical protein